MKTFNSRNYVVTGATGFIGRALVARLLRDGHRLTALVRDRDKARDLLGPDVGLASIHDLPAVNEVIGEADGVVNLAGENVFGGRWTSKRRRALVDSRLDTTRDLVMAMNRSRKPEQVLVSASAIGYYGSRGDETVEEESEAGTGFLPDLCHRWERVAHSAQTGGARVVLLRIGVVLGPEGGALASMLPPFRMGLGGRIGSGEQYMSWIHLHDLVELMVTALTDQGYQGAYNAVAPMPVTNAELTRALSAALARPAVIPVPALALRLAFGEAASVLLEGQRVIPKRALARGFRFAFPDVRAALADILQGERAVTLRAPRAQEQSPVEGTRPRHVLEQRVVIDAPLEDVFAFFSRAENLSLLTPAWTQFQIMGERPDETRAGTLIRYRLRVGPIPLRWRTRIDKWEPGQRFVDVQERGPYSMWWHEHSFSRDETDPRQTVMTDRVLYKLPMGFIGRLVHKLFVAPTLRRIFGYRSSVIRLRFGGQNRPTVARAA